MHVIFGNYGNGTIALIEWAKQNHLKNVAVAHIDTGWAAPSWKKRVEQGMAFAADCQFQAVALKANASFGELVTDRQSFPSRKFQWCPGVLKGLPLLAWLDKVDPGCEAEILLAKRVSVSRANAQLLEVIEESEHYGDRRVYHPLLSTTDDAFKQLIETAGFKFLTHRSLECDPCVNSIASDFLRLEDDVIKRTKQLEKKIGKPFFEKPIAEIVAEYRQKATSEQRENYTEKFDMGCGAQFACGD